LKGIAEALAHPLWLVERWAKSFGLEATRRICEAGQEVPTTVLRMPLDPAESDAIDAELRAAGVELEAGKLMINARRVLRGDVISTTAFRERRIAIQDEASQLVAALVGKGERILDCCAAPGGKTSAIAARNPQAEIVAAELHPHRARLLREMVTAKNVEVVAVDVAALPEQRFDRVLADVPCSGTGTLARNPEIKWRLKPEHLDDLHRRQVAILAAAIERTTAGGRIVYSTCSLEREENQQVVEEVMRERRDVRLLDVKSVLNELKHDGLLAWSDTEKLTDGVYLRTLPGVHPCDGFFAAVIEKVSG
jgi:16S rRNA (cytosine967-C5)-methyltransferase